MRSLIVLLSIALLGVGMPVCEWSSKRVRSRAVSSGTARGYTVTTIVPGVTLADGHLAGDGDSDNPGDIDGDGGSDNDSDNDSMTDEGKRYHDSDDNVIALYGHAAKATDRHAIADLVKRYYVAAWASDGAVACSLMLTTLAKAVPEDYGHASGAGYMRDGETCATTMSVIFEHVHRELTGAMAVTGVRMKGDQARALLGSTTIPASYITLKREHGAWKVEELLSHTLL